MVHSRPLRRFFLLERSTAARIRARVGPGLQRRQDSQRPPNVSRSTPRTMARRTNDRRLRRRQRVLLNKARQGGPRTPPRGGRPLRSPARRRRPQAAQAAGRDGPGAVYPQSAQAFVHGTHGTLARHCLLPTRLPSPIEPQREGFREHEEPTAILRPSGDAQTLSTYNWHLPSTRGPLPSPERNSRS